MAKKVGVLLSGCGVYDGTEIHEAVLTLLFLDRASVEIICTAPNEEQYDVINHFMGKQADEKRNVLIESARISRGKIKDLKDLKASDLDAIIIPGGMGAVKNLSNFMNEGADAKVHPEVKRILIEMNRASKPIGAICISPAVIAKVFCDNKPEVTIGNEKNTAQTIESMGAIHKTCTVDMICVDNKNKIVTTPAYMLGPSIKDVAVGIEKLVAKILEFLV
ncbi:MAG: isoprenoid biosynthesis glyoxalase ElbB [Desulfobacterales bacterium]|nr:isoprenoid biosynthesis glyoxalase ElbB [Desulfobacterales bacterium]